MPTNSQDSRRRTRPVRVLLADDHAVFAEALTVFLAGDDRIEVVGHASDGIEAIALARRLQPDVVLMDVHMPRLDGVEATRRLRLESNAARVVMLSSSAAVEDVERARAAGAAAYLTKSADAATIVREVVSDPAPANNRRAA